MYTDKMKRERDSARKINISDCHHSLPHLFYTSFVVSVSFLWRFVFHVSLGWWLHWDDDHECNLSLLILVHLISLSHSLPTKQLGVWDDEEDEEDQESNEEGIKRRKGRIKVHKKASRHEKGRQSFARRKKKKRRKRSQSVNSLLFNKTISSSFLSSVSTPFLFPSFLSPLPSVSFPLSWVMAFHVKHELMNISWSRWLPKKERGMLKDDFRTRQKYRYMRKFK